MMFVFQDDADGDDFFMPFRMRRQSSRICSSDNMYTMYGPVTVMGFRLPGPRTLLALVLVLQSAHEMSTL